MFVNAFFYICVTVLFSDCLISWIEVASKLNRRDDCCRKHFLATATKEQKLQMKTLRVKQNKANSKKYARKEDKSKLTHAVSVLQVTMILYDVMYKREEGTA